MSDGTPGEGWWQASDGQWYPPEQHPEYQAGATQPIGAMPPPTAAMPPVPPTAPVPMPGGPPPGGPVGPPPGSPAAGSNNAKWIIAGVVAVAVIAIAAFLLLGGDDKKKVATTSASSSSSSSSSSKSSSSSSKSSSSTSSSSSKSSSSSSSLSASDLQSRMLSASDIGPDFIDETFTVDNGPTNCGQPNIRESVPPKGEVGSQSSNGVASFREDAAAFNSSSDAQDVLDLIKSQTDQTTCPSPTIPGGEPIVFSQPTDVSSSVTTKVEAVFEIDFQTPEQQGQFFVIKDGVAIVTFEFVAQQGTDTSQLPDAIDLVNAGLKKILNG